jgi:mono/diheme cytochrome c family protein
MTGRLPLGRLALPMRHTAAVLLAIAVLLLAACGGEETVGASPDTVQGSLPTETTATTSTTKETGNATAGKQVFESAGCGGCHTLADAGTSGNVGPNLDDAKPDYSLVVDRVTNGQGVMPAFKDQLNAQQIQDVAAYVSSTAGQ